MSFYLLFTACAITTVLGCADHTGRQHRYHTKRQEVSSTNPSKVTGDWAYDASYNWGAINPEYVTCQTGTQQSPIALSLTYGLSSYHKPSFSGYDKNASGTWTNWGYGPGFNLSHPDGDYTALPALRWDNNVAYLKGWHIHSPADHWVQGDRSKAELHLAYIDEKGHESAVIAILLDAGGGPHPFFAQLPEMIPFRDPKPVSDVSMNLELLLSSVYHLNEFWTYMGSLTSPPCMEGIRWFVARLPAFMSVDQMQAILKVTTFSAREEQKIWMHGVNSA